MYNCQLHESVLTVSPTYKYNGKYDLVHVEAIFQTTEPIPDSDIFFVPSLEEVPNHILEILRIGGFSFQPIPKSIVIQEIANFASTIDTENKAETISDAMLGIAAQYMNKVKMNHIGNNFYHLSYDYALMPNPSDGSFVIKATIPFKGFQMPRGGQVRLITVLPTGAQVNRDLTKGIIANNQVLEEQEPVNVANGRTVVSFFYQNDPDFTIVYRY